jgi:beta-lactamase regulating signal transducer with metallopeptidase domain
MSPMNLPVIDAASLLVKMSLLLLVAATAHALVRHRVSAATRHLLWTLTIAGMLLLPALSAVLPAWGVPIRLPQPAAEGIPPAAAPVAATAINTPAPVPNETFFEESAAPRVNATPRFTVAGIAVTVYAAGVLLILAHVLMQRLTMTRMARNATPVDDPEWRALFDECAHSLGVDRAVRLLRSRDRTMPMTFGTRVPTILLPAIADTWTDDRRRAVVLHELAHVARFDCLTQLLATIACAVYWPHPGVWGVARQLRIERELACDDRVLTVGTQPRDYAGHLLEIAYSLGGGRAPALAVSMARPRQLEGRMLALLDENRNRTTPSPRSRAAALALATALVLPLAGAEAVVSVSATGSEVSPTSTNRSTSASADVGSGSGYGSGSGSGSGVGSGLGTGSASSSSSSSTSPTASASADPHATAAPHGIANAIAHAAANALGIAHDANDAAEADREDREQSPDPNDRLPGTWEVRPAKEAGYVYVQMREVSKDGRNNWSNGTRVPLDRFEGLSQAVLSGNANANTPVTFTLRRDAGTFTFKGLFQDGVGAGTYGYTANPNFPAELAKRGIARPNAAQQYDMARSDVGLDFIDELGKQGYQRADIDELIRAGHHGVRLDYVRDMGELGYKLGMLDTLITLRDHGVSAQYIRDLANDGFTHISPDDLLKLRDHGVNSEYLKSLRDAGYRPSLDDAVRARDHGVSAEFVRKLAEFGYNKLTLDEVINARDHGISADYVNAMRELGYTTSIDDMIKARDHGVNESFVREMTAAGYAKLPLDTLINARDHGISAEYVRDMSAAGYTQLPLDALVRARDHGVSPRYARELKDLGYDKIALDDLIELRNHGVSADRVRKANARAGTKLPLAMIKDLADGGGLR